MLTKVQSSNSPTTLEEFQHWEAPADGMKYEWFDGELITFEKMNKHHLKLIRLLTRLFTQTQAYQSGGVLIAEQEVLLTGIQLRRPDFAYFSGAQIDRNDTSIEPIPAFVIEVISPTDDAEKVESKRFEYFKAGVQVVWSIYPESQCVYVYTGVKSVVICTDEDVCSAAPVLNDFQVEAKRLFGLEES